MFPPSWLDQSISWLCAGLVLLTSCARSPRPQIAPAQPEPFSHALILVALDGVRWQEVFFGVDPALAARANLSDAQRLRPQALMPTLHGRVMQEGSVLGRPGTGAGIFASGPNYVSLPGYMELLSGSTAHGCTSNRCPTTRLPTLLDACRAMPDTRREDVAAISSWELTERAVSAHPSSFIISAGRHGGAGRELLRFDDAAEKLLFDAESAPAAPGQRDYRPDSFTSAIALHYLRTYRPRCLFIGLGDADEYAHARDYAGYLGALGRSDDFLRALLSSLDALGAYGEGASVLITTDHGRAANFFDHGASWPESSRVWAAAIGKGIAPGGLVANPKPARLSGIAPTARTLLGLAPAALPGEGEVIDVLLRGD